MTSSSVTFADAMRTALKADAAVAAIYGDRIYDRAPDNVGSPYISLGPSDYTLDTIGEDCGTQTSETLQIDAWHEDGGALWPARDGCKAIGLALHNVDLTLPGHQSFRPQLVLGRAFAGSEPDTARAVVQFTIELIE